jgi:hypothetical protein
MSYSKVLDDVILRTGQKLKLSARARAKKMKANRALDERLAIKVSRLESTRRSIQDKIDEANRKRYRLADERRHLTAYQSVLISHEAFIGYLQQFKGLDVDAIQDEILALDKSNLEIVGPKIVRVNKEK